MRPVMLAQFVVPPAPKVHDRDLPGWRVLFAFNRNTISVQSNRAFEELIVRRRIFGIDSILINEPEDVRHVLTTAMEKYKRRAAAERILAPLVGKGVLLAAGSQWRRQRRMLAPVFTPASIGSLLRHFEAAANGLLERIDGSTCANLSVAFQEAALEAVLRALFTLPDSSQRGHIASMGRHYLAGPGRPNVLDAFARNAESFAFAMGARRRFRKAWSETLSTLVSARRDSRASAPHGDLLDLLLAARDPKSGEALSEAEIRDQCSTMLVAGYEAAARLLFWATYLLTLDMAE